MNRARKIPPLVLLITVLLLSVGQLFCGTGLFWVTATALMMLSIGVSYNMLGGLSTIGGIAFTALALESVVISQFAKVFLLQAADSNIAAPEQTIATFAGFYFCAAIGISFSRQFRLKLPHPLEPESRGQSMRLYAVTMPLGVVGLFVFNLTTTVYGTASESRFNAAHSAGVALEVLVFFAIVVAVDERITSSGGEKSLNLKAAVPMLAASLSGVIDSQRTNIILPVLLYFITCYLRGYKFRRRHYMFGGAVLLAFPLIISPLALFMRADIAGHQLGDRIRITRSVLEHLNWQRVKAGDQLVASGGAEWEDYYDNPEFAILNRFSRIRTDSNLILATEQYHYGFAAIEHDVGASVPHMFYKNKPINDSADFLGRVSGQSAGIAGNTEPAYTLIADSYGGFGWIGVIVFGAFVFPFCLMVYESIFDMSRPWGTLAVLSLATLLPEGGTGRVIAVVLLRTPITLLLLSYALGIISRMIPIAERGRSASWKLDGGQRAKARDIGISQGAGIGGGGEVLSSDA